MPMIIKNGKRYCSTGGEAENVVYNNTESGLEATNMQDAIDELNSKFDDYQTNVSESGTIQTGAISAKGTYSTIVKFNNNFTKIPTVRYTFTDTGQNLAVKIEISEVSTSGFKLTVTNSFSGSAIKATITWIAESSNSNKVGFVDYANPFKTFTTSGETWVATQDCCIAGTINQNKSNPGKVTIDGVVIGVAYIDTSSYGVTTATSVFVKKGQTVVLQSNGIYAISAYPLL